LHHIIYNLDESEIHVLTRGFVINVNVYYVFDFYLHVYWHFWGQR